MFATPLLLDSVRDLAGVFGPPMILQPVIWLSLVALAGLIVVADPTARDAVYGRATRWLCAAIFIAAGAIVLALLYLQWNGLGALSVKGFQGRYLCPSFPCCWRLRPRRGVLREPRRRPADDAACGRRSVERVDFDGANLFRLITLGSPNSAACSRARATGVEPRATTILRRAQ